MSIPPPPPPLSPKTNTVTPLLKPSLSDMLKSKVNVALINQNSPDDPRDSKEPPSQIIPDFLYLGNEYNSSCLEQLEALKITHILNMTEEIDNRFESDSKISYRRIAFPDNEKGYIPDIVDQILEFIENARVNKGRVLVHCRLGVSRSVSAIIAYLLRSSDQSLKQVIEDIQNKRPIVKPNPSFIKQLMYLEKKNGETYPSLLMQVQMYCGEKNK